MPSKTDICNMALMRLAHSDRIGNFDENSTAADILRLFYDASLDKVLRDFQWPFATKRVALALAEADPIPEFSFSYRVPSDCVMFRKVMNGVRDDRQDTRITNWYGADDQSDLIYTDEENAIGEYTFRVSDPARLPADFVTAFSYFLASEIAESLTSGDLAGLGDKALKRYNYYITSAQKTAMREETLDTFNTSPSLDAR